MRERDVTVMFKRAFADYEVWTLNNHNASGWPDKLIQVEQVAVLAELKHVVLNQSNYFRLNEFRQDQAATMAKWQKNGGLCFLFIGISNTSNEVIGYAILIVIEWKDWLEVNKKPWQVEDMELFSESADAIKKWFRKFIVRW